MTLPAKPEDTPGKLKSLYRGWTPGSIIFRIVINAWNALSQKTVDSSSIASFKTNLRFESLDNFVTIHN